MGGRPRVQTVSADTAALAEQQQQIERLQRTLEEERQRPEQMRQAAEAAAVREQEARRLRGRSATILTSGEGLAGSGQQAPQLKTVLG